jgi:CRISPR/Cas system-associated endonuclease Cas1
MKIEERIAGLERQRHHLQECVAERARRLSQAQELLEATIANQQTQVREQARRVEAVRRDYDDHVVALEAIDAALELLRDTSDPGEGRR